MSARDHLDSSLPASPTWLADAVFYQVYLQSFQDSNGNGIGDLPGLISKLDYIASLGVTALWLSPIHPSQFRDGGYDVTDFYGVAPRYGTLADVRTLFREAHQRGLRVCLDLVAGHTSDEHPWFRASAQAEQNRFTNWFIWTQSVWAGFNEPAAIKGATERDGAYLANFFHFQPALNYGFANPDPKKPWQQSVDAPGPRAVRAELRRIMRHWLDLGCDGFRVDMASSLVRGDPSGSELRRFWRETRHWLARRKPEAVLIAEWGNPRAAIDAGFHVDFLLHFNEPAYQHLCAPTTEMPKKGREHGYFSLRKPGDPKPFLENYLRHLKATRACGYIALPTGNHDFARFRFGRSETQLRSFLALLFFQSGIPFIYYGDEVGLDFRSGLPSKEGGYSRTGTRTPMQWTSGRNRGFSNADAEQLYLPVDGVSGRDVAAQELEPESLLNFTRKLLRLRKQYAALGTRGSFTPIVAGAGKPLLIERRHNRRRFLLAIHPSDCRASLRHPALLRSTVVASSEVELHNGTLRFHKAGYCLLEVLGGRRASGSRKKPSLLK